MSGPAVAPVVLSTIGPRVEQRVVLGEDRAGDAVPAGVGELEADEQVGVVAPVRRGGRARQVSTQAVEAGGVLRRR